MPPAAEDASALVAQLRYHLGCKDFAAATQACTTVYAITGQGEEGCRQILAAGGMGALADLLAALQRSRTRDASTLLMPAAAIADLVRECGEDGWRAALGCAAIPALVQLLHFHGGKAQQQREEEEVARYTAMDGLCTLANCSEECRRAIAGAPGGAVQRLVQFLGPAYSAHINDGALTALHALLVPESERVLSAFASAGGIPPLVRLLTAGGRASSRSLRIACNAVSALTYKCPARTEAMAACRTIPAVVGLLGHSDLTVAAAAAGALANLVLCSPDRSNTAVAAEAMPPLLRLLRQQDDSCILPALSALYCLVFNSKAALRALVSKGAASALQQVADSSSADKQVRELASETLAWVRARVCAGPGCRHGWAAPLRQLPRRALLQRALPALGLAGAQG
ncbi:hypothetical protein ABPG75_012324 [Micractinium tetrahymenae]